MHFSFPQKWHLRTVGTSKQERSFKKKFQQKLELLLETEIGLMA